MARVGEEEGKEVVHAFGKGKLDESSAAKQGLDAIVLHHHRENSDTTGDRHGLIRRRGEENGRRRSREMKGRKGDRGKTGRKGGQEGDVRGNKEKGRVTAALWELWLGRKRISSWYPR